jgi:hypothetical protein
MRIFYSPNLERHAVTRPHPKPIRVSNYVRAAITPPWSNEQTEGQITKLKLVNRQMYGRAKIDLLQARLIGVPA